MIIQVKVPAVGESITEVVMGEWFKRDGEAVTADEPIAEIESDKATMEIPAEQAGVLRKKVETGATLAIGDIIAEIDTEGAPTETSSAAETGSPPKASATRERTTTAAAPAPEIGDAEKVRITPVARKILEDHQVSADGLKGTGIGGKITKEDARRAVAAPSTESARPGKAVPTTAATGQPVRRERMTTLRQTIANRLVSAKNEMAMLTTINEVDMSAIMTVRQEHREAFQQKYGVKLGFMSFFSLAVCRALQDWPAANARVDGTDIVYHDYVNLGIAVSTPKGLVVPVIRDAHGLGQPELEVAILELAEKARSAKLAIDDMLGGTFTITNGGVFGSLLSTPIINPPQVAVLGMHTIQERPVVRDGQIVIRPMMYVSLSYDHRIIDGRESVSVLIRMKELLETPDPADLKL